MARTRVQQQPMNVDPVRPDPTSQYWFLDLRHPIHWEWEERWRLNEQRLAGGDDVSDELQAFDWEVLRTPGSNYVNRQLQAVYPNYPDDFMGMITGHLLRFAPKPDSGLDFGTLGQVRRDRSAAQPTDAELVYFSVDSPGQTGTPWEVWWSGAERMAGATGHRWVYVTTPGMPAFNRQDILDGSRPYLIDYSPIDVPIWAFGDDGKLDFAVVRFDPPEAIYNQQLVLQRRGQIFSRHYLLLVREGFPAFGEEFVAGGWFKFDGNQNMYDEGDFADCDGELPFFPLFYQRSKGSRRAPAMSRPAITEMGAAAIAYMNLMSAANFDAWDSASSISWLEGVDDEGYALAKSKLDQGSRLIPLPPNQDTDAVPRVNHGSAGAVQHQVFDTRIRMIEKAVTRLGVAEVSGKSGNANTHTGASKEATFSEQTVPRIVHVASNLGAAQNLAIYFLEKRFGNKNPSGAANWPSKIDLVELVDKIQAFFEVERIAGIRSPTLDARAMTQLADLKGLITKDDDRNTIEAEYKASAEIRNKLEQSQARMVDQTVKNTPIAPIKPGAGPSNSTAAPVQDPTTAASQANNIAANRQRSGKKNRTRSRPRQVIITDNRAKP